MAQHDMMLLVNSNFSFRGGRSLAPYHANLRDENLTIARDYVFIVLLVRHQLFVQRGSIGSSLP